MKAIHTKIKRLRDFFGGGIWEVNMETLSKGKAKLVKDLKIIMVALKNFRQNRTGFQSIALCYFCLMATVPFIAVFFALTDGFGLTPKLLDLLYHNLETNQELIDKIMEAARNIIASAQSGIVGIVSALMFVWLIIWMMMRTETVFNDIWHVRRSRNFFKKLGINIVIMLLSPFIILLFFSGSIVYTHVLDNIIPGSEISDAIKSFLGWIIFGVLVVFVFSAMYKFIPAAKVRYGFALKASLISGLAFTLLQYLYLETQVMVTRLNAVYGTIAALPLFILWLRFGWLIILYGAQFSYSFQKVEYEEIEQL